MPEEQEQGQQQKPHKEDTSKPVQEEAIQPRLSVWPFTLAVALVVLLIGFITTQPIILGIGVVLVIVAIIGWGVERR